MAKEEVSSTTEPWNIAGNYVLIEILTPLALCSKLKQIAEFGTEHIEDSVFLDDATKTKFRIEAMFRLHSNLRRVMTNTNFCIKKLGKEKFDDLRKNLKDVKDVFHMISKEESDQMTHQKTKVINEEHFNNCLEALDKVNEDIRKPLNDEGLIFPTSEDIDLDKIKDQLIHGG